MLRRIITTMALTAAVAAPVALAAPAQAAAREVKSGCATVAIIGARGSGQPHTQSGVITDFGPQLSAVSKATAARLNSRHTVRYIGIPYQAVNVKNAEAVKYNASVKDGVNRMTTYLVGTARSCPNTKIVLAGYSQGAQVARTVAGNLSNALASRVAVLLLADPKRNFNDGTYGLELNFGSGAVSNGVLKAGKVLPTNIRTHVIVVCYTKDPVCNSPANLNQAVVGGASTQTKNHSDFYLQRANVDSASSTSYAMLTHRMKLSR